MNPLKMLSRGGAVSAPSDADFENVTLLLHGDGTNGAQNNTFLDSSTNNFTITRNGNTTQGTFTPFSKPDGRWGTYYDGTDDYLSVADNAVLRPGAGAFTLEAWIYRNASGAAHTIYAKGGASTGISFLVTSGNVLRFTHTTTNIDSSGTVAANAWVHVAVVREGTGTNQTKLYINGTQDGQGTVTTDFTQTEEVRIGTNRGATDDFAGYISNVRFVKGSALYTGNFTPSTSPFTTTSQGASSSEVELLTCQSNRFVDNSTNNFTITRNGDVRVTPFSPFPTLTVYDAATNGGSGYFDGSGDYLRANNAALNPSATAVTVDFWFYPTASGTNLVLFAVGDGSTGDMACFFDGGNIVKFQNSGVSGSVSTNVVRVGQWNYIVCTKDGSNNYRVYVNDVAASSVALSAPNSKTQLDIGGVGASASTFGYISGFRYTTGAANAPSGFPTSPPTTTVPSGTCQLLLNCTNAGIIDNSMSNNLETVGNAQIDTTTKKYGTGSMEFDGTGDYLLFPVSQDVSFGSGDFTVEGWINASNSATTSGALIVGQVTTGGAANTNWALFKDITTQGNINFYASDGSTYQINGIGGAGSLNDGNWHHFAVTRSGSSFKVFVDGTQVGSTGTWSGAISSTSRPLKVGYNGSSEYLNGLIDELRITKGIARYTTTFTPPTAAFPDIGE